MGRKGAGGGLRVLDRGPGYDTGCACTASASVDGTGGEYGGEGDGIGVFGVDGLRRGDVIDPTAGGAGGRGGRGGSGGRAGVCG